jgi:peptide/nickel transport system substrate-binding protein
MIANAFAAMRGWAYPVAPKAIAVLRAHPKSTLLASHTFGAGPWVYVPSQSVTGDHCTFLPNPYYYDKAKVRWGKVFVKVIVDANAELAALKAGQLDLMENGANSISLVAKQAGLRVVAGSNVYHAMIFEDLGKGHPPLDDVRVRQAIAYALDMKRYLPLYPGPRVYVTDNSSLSGRTGLPARYENYYSYDPAKARALLAAAGHPNGFTFKTLCFGAWYGPNRDDYLCQAEAQDLAKVGITMVVDAPAGADGWSQEVTNGRYDVFMGCCNDWQPWMEYQYNSGPRGFFMPHHAFDPVLNRLFLQAQRAAPARANQLWNEYRVRIITQAYRTPSIAVPSYAFVTKAVGGVAAAYIGSGAWGQVNDPIDWYPTGK